MYWESPNAVTAGAAAAQRGLRDRALAAPSVATLPRALPAPAVAKRSAHCQEPLLVLFSAAGAAVFVGHWRSSSSLKRSDGWRRQVLQLRSKGGQTHVDVPGEGIQDMKPDLSIDDFEMDSLRRFARANGIRSTGQKSDLIQRLVTAGLADPSTHGIAGLAKPGKKDRHAAYELPLPKLQGMVESCGVHAKSSKKEVVNQVQVLRSILMSMPKVTRDEVRELRAQSLLEDARSPTERKNMEDSAKSKKPRDKDAEREELSCMPMSEIHQRANERRIPTENRSKMQLIDALLDEDLPSVYFTTGDYVEALNPVLRTKGHGVVQSQPVGGFLRVRMDCDSSTQAFSWKDLTMKRMSKADFGSIGRGSRVEARRPPFGEWWPCTVDHFTACDTVIVKPDYNNSQASQSHGRRANVEEWECRSGDVFLRPPLTSLKSMMIGEERSGFLQFWHNPRKERLYFDIGAETLGFLQPECMYKGNAPTFESGDEVRAFDDQTGVYRHAVVVSATADEVIVRFGAASHAHDPDRHIRPEQAKLMRPMWLQQQKKVPVYVRRIRHTSVELALFKDKVHKHPLVNLERFEHLVATDNVIPGTVVRPLPRIGLLVEVCPPCGYPAAMGLIHFNDAMSRYGDPMDWGFEPGDIVKVQVASVNKVDGKLGLRLIDDADLMEEG